MEDSGGIGDNAMGIRKIKEWYNQFKEYCKYVECYFHSGWPSTSQNDLVIDQVQTLVMQDHCIHVRGFGDNVEINIGLVHSILCKDLDLWRVTGRFVPELLMKL